MDQWKLIIQPICMLVSWVSVFRASNKQTPVKQLDKQKISFSLCDVTPCIFCISVDPHQMQIRINQPQQQQPPPQGMVPAAQNYPPQMMSSQSQQNVQVQQRMPQQQPTSIQAIVSLQQRQNRVSPVGKPTGLDPIEILNEREHRYLDMISLLAFNYCLTTILAFLTTSLFYKKSGQLAKIVDFLG